MRVGRQFRFVAAAGLERDDLLACRGRLGPQPQQPLTVAQTLEKQRDNSCRLVRERQLADIKRVQVKFVSGHRHVGQPGSGRREAPAKGGADAAALRDDSHVSRPDRGHQAQRRPEGDEAALGHIPQAFGVRTDDAQPVTRDGVPHPGRQGLPVDCGPSPRPEDAITSSRVPSSAAAAAIAGTCGAPTSTKTASGTPGTSVSDG